MYEPAQPSARRGAATNPGSRSCGALDVTGPAWLRWLLGRSDVMGISLKQLDRDCTNVTERFKDKTFDDLIAAFGPPIEDRAATPNSGRTVVFRNVTKTIGTLVVLQKANGKFEFRFQAGDKIDDAGEA